MTIICLSTTLLTVSCVSIYFNKPQPIDSKNIKKFPKNMRGTWVSDGDTVTVRKKTFRKVEWAYESISRAEIDSNESLIIKNNQLFDLESDSSKGYYYKVHDDSFLVYIPQIIEYKLDEKVLFRRVPEKYYTLNVNVDSIWWDVFLIERLGNGTVVVRYPQKKELDILETILGNEDLEIVITHYVEDEFTTSEFQKFWNVGLTSKQLLEFVDKGGFSDTTLVLDPKNKID